MKSDVPPATSRRRWPIVVLALGLLTSVGLAADWWSALSEDATANYVGKETCAKCHQAETHAWTGSDHDRAMELATEQTVLGDFNDATFTRHDITSKMFRKAGKYFIHTEGPTGELQDFEIKYTFGVRPLQQYMVEFPDGRVQVLRISWDTKEKKWFYLTPPDVPEDRILPGDPLHWTGVGQNWNHTCADCHSTNLHKNFDLATNTFHTTFEEINVSCEACHGPGSMHVELAEAKSLFWDRRHGYGLVSLKGANPETQLQICAQCHSRRDEIHADFRPGEELLDYYDLSTLRETLYHPDGQIQDEVYEHGSFLQSKMYRKQVRCTDCHNPHSTKVYFTDNRLCAKCHQPGKYDTPLHHHHPAGSSGTKCVECHMPTTTYMEVDPRRDHSLRIPRPDLSVLLGTPNACNKCHVKPKEDADWAAKQVATWFPAREPVIPHYALAIAAGRKGELAAVKQLLVLLRQQEIPDIVRATAIELLAQYNDVAVRVAITAALRDPLPLVRVAAVRSYSVASTPEALAEAAQAGIPPEQQIEKNQEKFLQHLAPLLTDKVRLVRIAAARRLLEVPLSLLSTTQNRELDAALHEVRAAELMASDRGGPHLNLGNLYQSLARRSAMAQQRSRTEEFAESAIEEFKTAIKLEPYLAGPRSNLADLYEQLETHPEEVKQLRKEELELLQRDARLLPDNAMVWHRLGSAQYLAGELESAQESLERTCKLEPDSYDYRLMLTLLYEKRELWAKANESVQILLELRPKDPDAQVIQQRLKAHKP